MTHSSPPQQSATPGTHTAALCTRIPGSDRFAADMGGRGSGSVAYRCPECKRRGRFNTNFLGSRHVVCNGVTFQKVADHRAALRGAGVDLKKELAR